MFTGLVEAVGRVATIEEVTSGRRLRFQTSLTALRPGDSVSVNGVCLTATAVAGDMVSADVGPETLRVTTLGGLKGGDIVNLERSMPADGRFGGHFVQGHVDGTGTIESIQPDGDAHWLTIAFPGPLAPLLVPKGSVAIDGISLTVAALRDSRLDVMIIPFTWQATNLASRQVGDAVNLECDMIGKYVARILEVRAERRG
jgi:riboflavin synthase